MFVGNGVGRTLRGFSSIRKSERTPLLQEKSSDVSAVSKDINSASSQEKSDQNTPVYPQYTFSDTGDTCSITDLESSVASGCVSERHKSYDWSLNNFYEASIDPEGANYDNFHKTMQPTDSSENKETDSIKTQDIEDPGNLPALQSNIDYKTV